MNKEKIDAEYSHTQFHHPPKRPLSHWPYIRKRDFGNCRYPYGDRAVWL